MGLLTNGVPLAGDGTLNATLIKIVIREPILNLLNGLQSDHYGWPGVLDFRYWPHPIMLELIILKLSSELLGIQDPAVLLHIFAVIKATPIALAGYFFFRQLSVARAASAVLGISFSVMSFNLIRAEGHFTLGFTWSIPLVLGLGVSLWRLSNTNSNPLSRRLITVHFIAGAACGLSAFYFALFNGILVAVISLLVFLKLTSNEVQSSTSGLLHCVRKFSPLFSLPLGILTGLGIQLWPSVVRGITRPAVTPVVARSWIEPIIYSGSVESYFFDAHALFLRIVGRPDALAFLDSRTVWEARQVGAVAGVLTYVVIIGLVLFAVKKLLNQESYVAQPLTIDERWLALCITIVFSLYFASGVNFTVSRTVLAPIRAWGRLSPYFMLLLVGFCLVWLSSRRFHRFSVTLLVIMVALIQLLEVREFRMSRPPSTALAAAHTGDRESFVTTLGALEKEFPLGCPLVQLPIYPFPEFDRPDDRNLDYAHFQLPLHDSGYFKWSYGAVKNTFDSDANLALALQVPPFARPSLRTQISAYESYSPCGYVVDSSLLIESERGELSEILSELPPECRYELPGAQFEAKSRYQVLRSEAVTCSGILRDPEFLPINIETEADFAWQYLSVQTDSWESAFPLTLVTNQISIAYSNLSDTEIFAFLHIDTKSRLPSRQEILLNVCYEQSTAQTCTELEAKSDGVTRLAVGDIERAGVISFSIQSPSLEGDDKWSVVLRAEQD